ncbi:Protein translocase subunit SecA, partial [Candidatus Arcanobacter lacustris]
MSVTLLELFFEDDYFYKSCVEAGCSLEKALSFYKEHINEGCNAPSEFFHQNPQYLYYDAQHQHCRAVDWSLTLAQSLNANKDIIRIYSDYVIDSDSPKVQKFVRKNSEHSLDDLELLLDKSTLLDTLLIPVFLDNPKYHLSEISVSYLEKILKSEVESGENPFDFKKILINYSAHFAINGSHAVILAKFLNDSAIIDFCSKEFLSAIDNGREFNAEVFEAFEKIILEKPFNEKLLSFLAYGAISGVYCPQDESIKLFKQYLQKNPYHYIEAISSTFEHGLENKSANLTLMDEIIADNSVKGFLKLLPLSLKEKIVNYYLDKTDSFKDFSTKEQSISDETIKEFAEYKSSLTHLTSILEKLLDYDSVKHAKLPKPILDKIIASSLLLTSLTKESNIIKKVIFIITRLGQQHIELPQDVLSYFTNMLSNQDPFVQRLAFNLYKKLSHKYIVNNVDELLNMDMDLDTSVDIIDILKNSKLSDSQSAKFIELESKIDEKIEVEKRGQKSNNIIDKIKAKNLSSWNEAYEELLKIQLDRFFAVGWRQELISRIIAKLSNDNFDQFKRVMGRIYDYGMSHKILDRNGNNISEIILQQDPSAWLSNIWKSFNDNEYYDDKDRAELIAELIKDNTALNVDSKLADYLNNNLDAIKQFEENHPINTWTEEDFKSWRKDIVKVTDDNIAEVIAVLKQAVKNTSTEHFYPRDNQIISILIFLKSDKGRLAQIATGEGKSLIIAMLAAIKVIDGRQVDVVTSSWVLAKEGLDAHLAFYKLLNISASHNAYNPDNGETIKECYNDDIVYGELTDFIGDYLRDITENVKNGRGFDTVLVDEADNMFIDQTAMRVQIASSIPGFESFRKLLLNIWGFQGLLNGLSAIDPETKQRYFINKQQNTENPEDVDFSLEEKDSREETSDFIGNEIIKSNSRATDKQFIFPRHLYEFIDAQLPLWINSSIDARDSHQENISYRVSNSHYYNSTLHQNYIITPIDHLNTGVTQFNLNWGEGLHQFLQMKHHLKLTTENLVSVFQSYVSYFLQYKGNIYGMTGTLGSASHQEFLRDVYKVDFVHIPNFIHKKITRFPDIVSHIHNDWIDKIVEIAQNKAMDDKRVVLIIAKDIETQQEIYQALVAKNYPKELLKEYGDSTNDSAIKGERVAGEIIIATNLAGRGTDIKISDEVENNGGLHVIFSFFAKSIRVEDQGFGRAARNGESGSAQLVVEVPSNPGKDNLSKLFADRDIEETKTLLDDQFCRMPNQLMQDELFQKYVNLIRNITSPTGIETIVGYNNPMFSGGKLSNAQAYLYIKNSSIYLQATKNSYEETFEISSELRHVNEKIFNHITTILSRPDMITLLNQRDIELINFIMASKGYSYNLDDVLKRINNKYDKLWSSAGNWFWSLGGNVELSQAGQKLIKSDSYYEYWFSNTKITLNEVKYLEALLINQKNYTLATITEEDILKIRLEKRYELWLEDRALYNKEFEIMQIQEEWAMWLKDQNELLADEDKCSAISKRDNLLILANNEILKKYLFGNFTLFATKMIKAEKDQILLTTSGESNPAYAIRKAFSMQKIHDDQQSSSDGYAGSFFKVWSALFGGNKVESYYKKAPLDEALDLLAKAVVMDLEHSWQAENGLAYIKVVKDSPNIRYLDEDDVGKANNLKRAFVEYSQNALKVIYRTTIPQAERSIDTLKAYIKVRGQWRYLYRAVDKYGFTIDFCLRAKRDAVAAKAFFRKAIRLHGKPIKINVDKSGANKCALDAINDNYPEDQKIEIRQNKYLNNMIEQDHRF